jgi:DNA-binding transcriptional ArsR family regulator
VDPGRRSLLWYLLVGTRGGPNRLRILDELRTGPRNAHQLAQVLELDYRTARHHLNLLERSGLVVRPVGRAYASPYELSPEVMVEFGAIAGLVGRDGRGPRLSTDRAGRRPRGATT